MALIEMFTVTKNLVYTGTYRVGLDIQCKEVSRRDFSLNSAPAVHLTTSFYLPHLPAWLII